MIRKFKVFGLALVSVIALGAASASAAFAVEAHSGSGSATTFLTGTQIGTNQLDTEGGNIKCSGVNLAAKYSGTTAATVDVTPSYTGCTAFGLTAHIDFMGCFYRFTSITASHIDVNVLCPPGTGPVTIIVTQGGNVVCTVDVAEQTVPANVTNEAGSPDDLKVTPESTSIGYTVTYPGGTGTKCGGVGAHSDGTYTGSVTARAYENESHTAQVSLTYN
jgi:hypothetical protein